MDKKAIRWKFPINKAEKQGRPREYNALYIFVVEEIEIGTEGDYIIHNDVMALLDEHLKEKMYRNKKEKSSIMDLEKFLSKIGGFRDWKDYEQDSYSELQSSIWHHLRFRNRKELNHRLSDVAIQKKKVIRPMIDPFERYLQERTTQDYDKVNHKFGEGILHAHLEADFEKWCFENNERPIISVDWLQLMRWKCGCNDEALIYSVAKEGRWKGLKFKEEKTNDHS